MSSVVILDTSIFIDHLRDGRHGPRIEALTGLVRTSSVVLAELWHGATKASEQALLRELERNHPVLTPSRNNWIESGQILARMRAGKGFSADKLRDLHFDVLIALTARSCGVRLITSNRGDFELIRDYRRFLLEVW